MSYHKQILSLPETARGLRVELKKKWGEREYALQLLDFNREVAGDPRSVAAAILLSKEPLIFQLALLWLDGYQEKVQLAWPELIRYRQKLHHLSEEALEGEISRLLKPASLLKTNSLAWLIHIAGQFYHN